MQNPLARAAIPLDPQRTVRPWPHADDDQHLAVHHWQSLLGSGLIENRNPPTPPAVAAQREANDALFTSIAADRSRLEHSRESRLARECRA